MTGLAGEMRRGRQGRPPGHWKDALVAALGAEGAEVRRGISALIDIVAIGVEL